MKQNSIAKQEHDLAFGVKKVSSFIDNGSGALVRQKGNSSGEMNVITGFEIPAFDYIALTYVGAGNGVGEIETAVYKTGGSGGTTVATLTLAYNASNEVSSVTKT